MKKETMILQRTKMSRHKRLTYKRRTESFHWLRIRARKAAHARSHSQHTLVKPWGGERKETDSRTACWDRASAGDNTRQHDRTQTGEAVQTEKNSDH